MLLEKKVKKEPSSKISLEVTVNKDTVNKWRETVVRDLEKSVKIPGFRKGKAPRNIIISRFSEAIKNKTITSLLSNSLKQVIAENALKPISEPVVTEMGNLILDEAFTFKAEFDVMPEIEVGEYKGISVEKQIFEVTEEAADREMEDLRERFATLVSVDEEATAGSYLVIDYIEYTPDGKKRTEKKNQTILLDDHNEQLTKQLIGLSKGDEKEVEIKEEYTQEEKRKPYESRLHVAVKEVKKKKLPELNDEFAQDISDVDSLEELRKKVKEELEKEAARLSEDKTKEELLQKLIQNSPMELPKSIIDREIDYLLSEVVFSYKIDLERLKKDKKQYEEYRKTVAPRALQNLKSDFILTEIAQREKLEVKEAEVDEEIQRYATVLKKDFQSVKSTMQENRSIENLRNRLRLKKALNAVYENAQFKGEKRIQFKKQGGN